MRSSIWLSFLLLLSCSACGEKMVFDGRLIYGGQGIYSLELSDGKFAPIKALPSLSIDEVSEIDIHHLLISSFNLSPSDERSTISIYNTESKALETILVGSRGVYISAYKKVVFYDRKEQLSIADIDGAPESIAVIDIDANAYPMSVIPISKSEFLYESKRSGTHGIWKYSFYSGEAVELAGLKSCSLSHAVWRSSTSQLLCSEILKDGRFTGRYFLTDLSGSERRNISFGNGKFWPVNYIDSLDVIVLQERKASILKGEVHQVLIYKFMDGSKIKVSDNILLSRRVAYFED